MGKVVDMLHAKQISSPTGKAKWTRAAVDHLLSNGKYIAVIGMEKFMDAQFEKSARCNVDYDKEGTTKERHTLCFPCRDSDLIYLSYFYKLCYNSLKR